MAENGYSREEKLALAEELAGLIVEMSVKEACAKVGLSERSFYRWIASDKEVWQHYAHAREVLALKGEAELEQVNQDLRNTKLEPQQARVIADNIKWLMGRRYPKVYGEKQTVAHEGGDPNKPVKQELTVRWQDVDDKG